MLTIYKYPTYNQLTTEIEVHENFKIVKVGYQNDSIVLWVLHDTDLPLVKIRINTYGTGWEIEDPAENYIDTVQDNKGFVWHVFKEGC